MDGLFAKPAAFLEVKEMPAHISGGALMNLKLQNYKALQLKF
jgi:hypothetical protein